MAKLKNVSVLIVSLICLAVLIVMLMFAKSVRGSDASVSYTELLTDTLSQIVSACPGEIGVAVIINGTDTVAVNNKSIYPMMSVFKPSHSRLP